MQGYLNILEYRARIESIELDTFSEIHIHNLSPVFIHRTHQMGRLWAEKAESTARE